MNLPARHTILLVDDDAMVRSVAKKLLERLGYDVIPAASGEEAVTRAINNTKRIALVILDMIMPGMDGKATYFKLRELMPDAKVVICSGFAEADEIDELREAGAAGFLRKPFDKNMLRNELMQHLAPPALEGD